MKRLIDANDLITAFPPGESVRTESVRATIEHMPTIQLEQHEIGYCECANALLKMWLDNVLTDGEYRRIIDKLDVYWWKGRSEVENG